jgi:transcriptional adapter 2-alpha
LLVGIRIWGLGNWHAIEKFLQTKTARDCESHYFATYIDGEQSPLPPPTVLPPLAPPAPLPYDTTPRDSRPKISDEYNLRLRGKTEPTTPGELAGWMPKRHEFEVEYINEAEEIIAGLTFLQEEETEESFKSKLQQMNEYNEHLAERRFRTNFALEWGLLDHEVTDFGGQTPEEREMEQQLMPLAQVLPRPQLIEFARVLEGEMRSHADLQMLTTWKRNGIATHDEGFLFNQLQGLLATPIISEDQVEEWNALVRNLQNSSEFRAALWRQVMSPEENELTMGLHVAPAVYFRLKDLLIREHMVKGGLTKEAVELMAPDALEIVLPIYEMLVNTGILTSIEDCGQKSVRVEDPEKTQISSE